jgi:hypothetical protein
MSRGSYLLFLSLLIISSVFIASKKLTEREVDLTAARARRAALMAHMKEGGSNSAVQHHNMHKTAAAHPCIEECTEIFILECDDDKTKTTGHTEMGGNNKWGMDRRSKYRVHHTAGFRGNHNKLGIWDGDIYEDDEECDEEDDVEHSKIKKFKRSRKSKKGDHDDDKDCDDEDSIELDEDEHHEKKEDDDDKTKKEILKLKKLLKLYKAHHEEHHEVEHKKKNRQHKKKRHNKQKKQRKQRKHYDDEDCDDEDHHEKKQSKRDYEHHDEKEEHEDLAGFLERGH